MSHLRYDPVHDVEINASIISMKQEESHPKSDKVPISSLLADQDLDANEAEEEDDEDDEEEEDENGKKLPSKRVLLAYKRKNKDLEGLKLPATSETGATSLSRKRKREVRDVKEGDTNPIHRSRHLKKPDSEPLWRADIQHDFLQSLLTNNAKIFRNPYDEIDEDIKYWGKISDSEQSLGYSDKLTFFQLYLLSILKSNRISKILKDRLVSDLNYAFKFIILCLLVNFGRLNTTINFDYEMRSQLRTYHCIPVLQIHHDIFDIASEPEDVVENNGGGSGYTANSVKQLQDTPRLKTILKSVSDFNSGLNSDTYEVFLDTCKQTNGIDKDGLSAKFNLISLLFCISQYEEQIMDQFVKDRKFDKDRKSTLFNEIFNLNDVKPECKVQRLLWLMYLFAETDLTVAGNMGNPFGEVVDGENKIPKIEFGDEVSYNQDTLDELRFAEEMKLKRKNFLEIVENLSDNESVTKDGRLKLNKKGRKKRIINDNSNNSAAASISTVPSSRSRITPGSNNSIESNDNNNNTHSYQNHRNIAIKPAPAPTHKKVEAQLTGTHLIKEKVMNKFLKEYIDTGVMKVRSKRQSLGNLRYFERVRNTALDALVLDERPDSSVDYNEFKLSYVKTLNNYYHNATRISTAIYTDYSDEIKGVMTNLL